MKRAIRKWFRALLGGLPGCLSCQSVSGLDDLKFVPPPPPGQDWSCLGKPLAPLEPGTVTYNGLVRNLTTRAPVQNVHARVCWDDACLESRDYEAPKGLLEFTLDSEFNGFIELTSPGMLPALVEVLGPIGQMRGPLPEMRMTQPSTLAVAARIKGTSIDSTLGHVSFWTRDCNGVQAPNVSVTVKDGATPSTRNFYVVDGEFPITALDRTEASGAGGIVNLRADYPLFEARLAETGELISTWAARVRPGHTTFFVVEPDGNSQ